MVQPRLGLEMNVGVRGGVSGELEQNLQLKRQQLLKIMPDLQGRDDLTIPDLRLIATLRSIDAAFSVEEDYLDSVHVPH